jgi:hypothetical protein
MATLRSSLNDQVEAIKTRKEFVAEGVPAIVEK